MCAIHVELKRCCSRKILGEDIVVPTSGVVLTSERVMEIAAEKVRRYAKILSNRAPAASKKEKRKEERARRELEEIDGGTE